MECLIKNKSIYNWQDFPYHEGNIYGKENDKYDTS